jgi:hypothetical protein
VKTTALNAHEAQHVVARKGGGQPGNRNAVKHGRYTREARALRARIRDFKQRVKIALAMVDQQTKTLSPF